MNAENLIPGMKFARMNNLSGKEMEILVHLIEKPRTCNELANLVNNKNTTVYHLIQKLRFKNIIILNKVKTKTAEIYKINEDKLE